MKTLHTIAVYREDLKSEFKDLPLIDIFIHMFPFFNTGVILHEDLIIFFEPDGASKILKHKGFLV